MEEKILQNIRLTDTVVTDVSDIKNAIDSFQQQLLGFGTDVNLINEEYASEEDLPEDPKSEGLSDGDTVTVIKADGSKTFYKVITDEDGNMIWEEVIP